MSRSSTAKRSASKSLTKSDYEALASFRFALRQFLLFSEAAAATEGLSAQHHQALLAIKGFPGREEVTVGELAARLQIRPHSAVGLVNRLEAEHLVQRETAADDRRRVLVSLTPRGLEVLEKLSSAHKEELRRIRHTLAELLAQVVPE